MTIVFFFFLLFTVIFAYFLFCSINNRTHNILELVDILPNVSFRTSQTEVIITNKNGEYELTEELSNDLRLKKIP